MKLDGVYPEGMRLFGAGEGRWWAIRIVGGGTRKSRSPTGARQEINSYQKKLRSRSEKVEGKTVREGSRRYLTLTKGISRKTIKKRDHYSWGTSLLAFIIYKHQKREGGGHTKESGHLEHKKE